MNHKTTVEILALVFLVTLILYFNIFFMPKMSYSDFKSFLIQQNYYTPLIFILIQVILALLCAPTIQLIIIGGLMFGVWLGTIYSLIGALVSASCAYFFSRYLFPNWFANKLRLKSSASLSYILNRDWLTIIITRLIPVIPSNLTSYAMGIIRMRYMPFIIVTGLASLPGSIIFSWLGGLGDKLLRSHKAQTMSEIGAIFAIIEVCILVPIGIKFIKSYKANSNV